MTLEIIGAGRSIDELTGDADAGAGLANTTFKNVAHAKLAPDLLHVNRPALVSKTRVSRDDE